MPVAEWITGHPIPARRSPSMVSSRPSTVRFMRSATCASSRRYYRAAAPVSASSCCQGGGWVSGLSTPDTGTGLIAPGSLL